MNTKLIFTIAYGLYFILSVITCVLYQFYPVHVTWNSSINDNSTITYVSERYSDDILTENFQLIVISLSIICVISYVTMYLEYRKSLETLTSIPVKMMIVQFLLVVYPILLLIVANFWYTTTAYSTPLIETGFHIENSTETLYYVPLNNTYTQCYNISVNPLHITPKTVCVLDINHVNHEIHYPWIVWLTLIETISYVLLVAGTYHLINRANNQFYAYL